MAERVIPEKWKELYDEVDGDRRTYAEAIHILIEEVADLTAQLGKPTQQPVPPPAAPVQLV